MHYEITEHADYVRAVIGDSASLGDFKAFYQELQARCTALGFDRALVVVSPDYAVPSPDRLGAFHAVGFVDGFRLALVCAAWTLYQACSKAERAASQAGVQVRAFFQETEGVRWLLS